MEKPGENTVITVLANNRIIVLTVLLIAGWVVFEMRAGRRTLKRNRQ